MDVCDTNFVFASEGQGFVDWGFFMSPLETLQLDELESCAQSLELYRPILEYLSRHFNIPTIIV